MSESEARTPDTTDSSHEDGKFLTRLSLNSIPSIDRSEDESSSPSCNPNLAHTPPPLSIISHPNLAHTPPPQDLIPNQPLPNLAHTPPPPPAPQTGSEARAASRQSSSPRPSSITGDALTDTYMTLPVSSDPPTPDARRAGYSLNFKRSSVDVAGSENASYGLIGNSPLSFGTVSYGHPSKGVYSGSTSLGSIYGNCGPPPVPPPPLENIGYRDPQHRRDPSLNSVHSLNSFREFYDKTSLNQFISTSPKLSNRDIEMNKMSSIYGSTGDYAGLMEMFTDPVEEEGGERVVWEYHNVQLTRVPTYGFGIAVSGGRDNPHFRNGDPSVAISEVLKSGPAEGKLEVNDRLISANGISLENVDYARAVQILRDSGQTVHLVVKRRIVLPATPEPQTLKVTLTKNKRKDDFGIVLGCRIYVKEIQNRTIADRDGGLKEGDVLLRINNTSTENLSMKEARKLVDGTKEKLQLLVRRDSPGYSPQMSPDMIGKNALNPEMSTTRPNYSTQNLYVQPPSREAESLHRNFPEMDSKSNLRRPEPRFVSFKKEGSVGIRLTGGNDVGIFVTAVQPKSQAQLQGLIAGDKILKVNDMDMTGVTREEAVLYLMSLQDQIDLIVQTRINDYQQILSSQKGDLFYIRTHFHYEPSGKAELSFRSGDIFRVVDTLHNGVVGAWQVYRIGRNNQETQKGIVPNKARAEELATAQFNAAKKEQTQSESRSGFFKRRRNSRRSKSLGKDHWEDVVFADSVSKFPAYERVSLKHPGFVRPVVLFGPLSDLSRDKLLQESPEKFSSPQLDSTGEKPSGIIRLSAIREILERGKHAILDITPNAVDRLNYAQFYPIVIFQRAESKQIVKELRSGMPKGRMSSKKLFDQSVKLEKLWSHVFTATISLTQPDMWYKKMKEIIDKQQNGPIWMSEAKPSEALTDDFLFPMTSRLSYASSPESDLEMGPESRTPSKSPTRMGSDPSEGRTGRLVKSSSDPSIAAQEPSQPPAYTPSPSRMPVQNLPKKDDDRRKSQGGDSKYGFSNYGYPGRPPPHFTPDNQPIKADNTPLPAPPVCSTPSAVNSNTSYTPPYSRTSVPFSLPNKSSPHHIQHSPYGSPPTGGRSPPQNGFPPSVPLYNGHTMSPGHPIPSGHPGPPSSHPGPPSSHPGPPSSHPGHPSSQPGPPPSQPELPPKVNRASKPVRLKSSQEHQQTEFAPSNDTNDNNYINAGNSLERHNKSPYDLSGVPLGPNAHDDLKSKIHPKSPQDHYRYNRSLSQPPQFTEDPYRTDLKPMPPPKSNNYKPVPPPKPKSYQGWGYTDGRKGGCDRVGPYQSNGTLSDDYSGLDSGQGSSLDRKYETLGRTTYSKAANRGGNYYLNVPPPRDNTQHGGRDLPNHDHRGSAFELYKKPTEPRNMEAGGPHVQPQYAGPHPGFSNKLTSYMDQGSRYSVVDETKHKVLATARGVYDHKGGTLTSQETGVSVVIPKGALQKGKKQEIYFKVCQDLSLVPPLDHDKGETLLSPMVMCGPHGLQFLKPIELRLPHAASVSPSTWSFALKSRETLNTKSQWTNVPLEEQQTKVEGTNSVSVLVDHF